MDDIERTATRAAVRGMIVAGAALLFALVGFLVVYDLSGVQPLNFAFAQATPVPEPLPLRLTALAPGLLLLVLGAGLTKRAMYVHAPAVRAFLALNITILTCTLAALIALLHYAIAL